MASNQPSQEQVSIFLSTLKDIAEAVVRAAEAGTLKQVLQRIAYVAQQLVHSRYAALGIPSEQGTLKYFEVVGLSPEEIRQIGHPPIGRGLLGVIMHEREIVRLPHMRDDPRSVGFPAHHPAMVRQGDQGKRCLDAQGQGFYPHTPANRPLAQAIRRAEPSPQIQPVSLGDVDADVLYLQSRKDPERHPAPETRNGQGQAARGFPSRLTGLSHGPRSHCAPPRWLTRTDHGGNPAFSFIDHSILV